MNIKPAGHRLVVKPDEIETTTKSGIVLATSTQELREQLAQTDGVVVAMGDTCYWDKPSAWCKVGDRVIFGKYSGLIRGDYRIINDEDVVAVIEENEDE